jgi:uncharacterized membrane protein
MIKIVKNNQNADIRTSNKKFNLLVKFSIIIGILIISSFIIYYLLTPEPGYITFGILNEDMKAEDYPTEASVNESVYFYLTVGNYLDRDFEFLVQIKEGNNNTVLSSMGSNGTIISIIGNFSLQENKKWISQKLNVSFSQMGENQIIIAELWEIPKNKIEIFYNIIWLRLNITI